MKCKLLYWWILIVIRSGLSPFLYPSTTPPYATSNSSLFSLRQLEQQGMLIDLASSTSAPLLNEYGFPAALAISRVPDFPTDTLTEK